MNMQYFKLKSLYNQLMYLLIATFCHIYAVSTQTGNQTVSKPKINWDYSKVKVWGPGLNPSKIILPARYFFIHDNNNKDVEE